MYRIVAFTGAGISKASGIPTFEELGDLREKLSRSYFADNPEDFYGVLTAMKERSVKAMPNPAHLALAQYNIPVVTMNIDGLHARAGSKDVLELHGNLSYVFCPRCRRRFDFSIVKDSIRCSNCGAMLQPNVVLYGDSIPLYFDALDILGRAEEILVIGTSFYTSTAVELISRAQMAGIETTIINKDAENEVPRILKERLG